MWPIFRALSALKGPKLLNMTSKWAHSTYLCTPNSPPAFIHLSTTTGTPNGVESFLGKHIFDPFLTHFSSQNNPFSRHFVTLEGPKWLAMGSKWDHFTCLCTPNGLGSFLEKHIFDPLWSHFVPKNNPFSSQKGATTSRQRPKNTCFGIPCGPGSFFKKFEWPTFGTHLGYHLQLAAGAHTLCGCPSHP